MKKLNYLTNKEILPELLNFKETGIASEKFGKQILLLTEKLSNKACFAGYSKLWKEDMISSAIYSCLKYARSFNPEKTENAFAYLTSICWNSFRAFLNGQKNVKKIKDECYDQLYLIDKENSTGSAIDYTELKKWDVIENNDEREM